MQRKNRGFTLIEILTVVIIIGILASVVMLNIGGNVDDARRTAALRDVKTIEQALDIYKLQNGFFPSTDQGLEALVTVPSGFPEPRNWQAGGYIKQLPKDPWGNDYQYMHPGANGSVDIYSLGADGRLGGDGVNADIGNWN